jgi:hypothetical protein
MKNWKKIEGDIDYTIFQKEFSGKLTAKRYKLLNRYCRKNTHRFEHCGHEYDCCGCISYMYTDFTYKHNLVTVTQTTQFNY